MKNIRFTYVIFNTILFLICCVLSIASQAQSLEEENGKVLSRMDTESLNGKVVLNKAIALNDHLEIFRNREKNKEGAYQIHIEPGLMFDLMDMAERGEMEGNKKPAVIDKIRNLSRDEITASNIIPIGIVNLDALLLTEKQVEENIKAKSEGRSAEASQYETVELIAAGLLQDEIFQGEVQFQLSKELLYSNNKNEIRGISIDFLDGKGWQEHELGNELIQYQFNTIGEVGIYIKLVTERGTYITGSSLKINSLDPIRADYLGTVTEERKNGRIGDNVIGAEFAIFKGCDGVLNKPIIIAEGFDKDQKNNISDMVARFDPYLTTFKNHGYDLVFVNYNDGQSAIQDNAQALKLIINEIKNRIPR